MGTREDYQALMEKQLNEWKAQTEHFKAGAAQFEAHAKAQYEKNLEAYCAPNRPKRGRTSTPLKVPTKAPGVSSRRTWTRPGKR
jgi:hypothetical protein